MVWLYLHINIDIVEVGTVPHGNKVLGKRRGKHNPGVADLVSEDKLKLYKKITLQT